MDNITRVKCINSPYVDIQTQIDKDTYIVEWISHNTEVVNYDLSLMIPKVTYEDWVVCLYLKDNKFYRITEDAVIEMTPKVILEMTENFEVLSPNGKPLSDDELYEYCDYVCCGEADDMSCFVYFE